MDDNGQTPGQPEPADFAAIAAQQAAQQAQQNPTFSSPQLDSQRTQQPDPAQPSLPAGPDAEPVQQPPSTTIVQEMQRRGLNLPNDIDDDRLIQHLATVAQQGSQAAEARQELDQLKNHYMANLPAFTQWQQQRKLALEKKRQQEQQGQQPAWKDTIPQYNQEWEERVQWSDDHGKFIGRDTVSDMQAAEEMNRWYKHQRDMQRKLASDPFGLVLEAGGKTYLEKMREEIEHSVESRIHAQMQQQRVREQQEQFFRENASVFFQVDQQGNPLPDGQGGYLTTPLGDVWKNTMSSAEQFTDTQDEQKLFNLGLMATTAAAQQIQNQAIAAQQQQQMPTPQEQAAAAIEPSTQTQQQQQQQMFMDRAREAAKVNPSPQATNSSVAKAAAIANDKTDIWNSAFAETKQRLGIG